MVALCSASAEDSSLAAAAESVRMTRLCTAADSSMRRGMTAVASSASGAWCRPLGGALFGSVLTVGSRCSLRDAGVAQRGATVVRRHFHVTLHDFLVAEPVGGGRVAKQLHARGHGE
jgi:hypothetical protein